MASSRVPLPRSLRESLRLPDGHPTDLGVGRDDEGVLHVRGEHLSSVLWGLGFAHAHDRSLQLLLTRTIGRGQASATLEGSDELLGVDRHFRRLGLHLGLDDAVQSLEPSASAALAAYAKGVNARWRQGLPLELRALFGRPAPWRPADSILLARLAGYVSLGESQGEAERLLIDLAQAGVPAPHLEALFGEGARGIDVELLRSIRFGAHVLPDFARRAVPPMISSNNWVVSPARSASGAALLASDPHLEINRLPAVWCEVALQAGDRYVMGATMPGLPAILIGRTRDVAFGATYGFADATDGFVEHVKDRRVRRPGGFVPLTVRQEIIFRKGKAAQIENVFASDLGTLDLEPTTEGHYLATRWAGERSGARSMEAVVELWWAESTERAMGLLGRLESSFHWLIADRAGHIGYQMSGLVPRRAGGRRGLLPTPGWLEDAGWLGFLAPEELPRAYDPESGFLATANHDVNALGRQPVITVCQGEHRHRRIVELLSARARHGVEDFRVMQNDLVSLQALDYLAHLRPLLGDGALDRALAAWDGRYDTASVAATAFERFYRALIELALEGAGLPGSAVAHLLERTAVLADFFSLFDRALLAETSPWFGGRTRAGLYRAALDRAAAIREPLVPWGEARSLVMSHVLFAGRFPKVLGVDRGPFPLAGGRATIHQGQLFSSAGRATSFAPSYRFVTDLGTDEAHTALAGGPSDRPFSRWYASDLARWRQGGLKTLRP